LPAKLGLAGIPEREDSTWPSLSESLSRRVETLEAIVRELTEALKKPQPPAPVTAPSPAR
jgi:hypothetical protein